MGMLASSLPFIISFSFFVSVTLPITSNSKSHFLKISLAIVSLDGSRTISIRSWLSDNISSYADIFCARIGTFDRFISKPTLPFEAISIEDDVRPAAPMS